MPQHKELRRQRRESKIERKRQARQVKLKEQWLNWRSRFEDDDVMAMVEGLYSCELLSRNIAYLISIQTDYYHYFKLDNDGDLSRLCHFNELKNLWLKRNQNNIVEILKPEFTNRPHYFSDKQNQESFISYLDSVQNYHHRVILGDKEYNFISDKAWGEVTSTDRPLVYAKSLPDSKKQAILHHKNITFTFDSLVMTIEYGCQSYWRENWVKK